MYLTVVCYIEKENRVLMLHRTKKQADINQGKWIGPGGKFEPGESPEECLLREIREETGLTLTSYRLRGLITFGFVGPNVLPGWEAEYMFIYTADGFEGELCDCDEGELAWIEKDRILDLNLWPGDRIFLEDLRKNAPFFAYKMVYEGDELIVCHREGGEAL